MLDWPRDLTDADFCRLRFVVDFSSPCELRPGTMMRLRRPLRTAARAAFKFSGEDCFLRMQRLFDPGLSHDPVAVRKFQKPAPPFVIMPTAVSGAFFDAGDCLELEVLFLGSGIMLIHDFLECLIALGDLGLEQGEGRFEVTEIESLGIDGEQRPIWGQTTRSVDLSPEIHSLATYLQYNLTENSPLRIEMLTPARLIRAGRPLKSPKMAQLFPFMLRRVTSMLYAHCGLEVCPDPQWMLDAAQRIEVISAEWRWQDWREVGVLRSTENIGGVIGSLDIQGADLELLRWVIKLCSLFGIGKGAPYGAGHFRLDSSDHVQHHLPDAQA